MPGAREGQTGQEPSNEVWLVDLIEHEDRLNALQSRSPCLSAADLARLSAIPDLERRRLKRLAALHLRSVLESRFGPVIRTADLPRDRYGRPGLPMGHQGSFSLAHTGTKALAAVSKAPRIGADLELPRSIHMSMSRRALIEEAAARLSVENVPLQGAPSFLQAWTRLEALAKADGHGIGHLLTAIGAVGGGPARPEAASDLAASLGLTVQDLAVGRDIYASAAFSGGSITIRS